jgi:phosphoenolpyruvate carboxylase
MDAEPGHPPGAWFGCGTAFADLDARVLRSLYEQVPFFHSLVDALEMTLAKSSLEIASQYLELVPAELDPVRLYGDIASSTSASSTLMRSIAGIAAALRNTG